METVAESAQQRIGTESVEQTLSVRYCFSAAERPKRRGIARSGAVSDQNRRMKDIREGAWAGVGSSGDVGWCNDSRTTQCEVFTCQKGYVTWTCAYVCVTLTSTLGV